MLLAMDRISAAPVSTPKSEPKKPAQHKQVDGFGASVGAHVGDAVERGVRVAADGARKGAELALDAGVKTSKAIGKHVADAARPLVEPTIREVKEAAHEVGDAGSRYVRGLTKSLNPFHGVSDILKGDGLSGGSKTGAVVGKVLDNVITDGVDNVRHLANLGKEAAEGAAEIMLNSPGANAVKAIGAGSVALAHNAARAAVDSAVRGARAAVDAGSVLVARQESISRRSREQEEENRREVSDAAKQYLAGWAHGINPLHDISDAWDAGDGVGSKIGAVAGQVAENSIASAVSNAYNAGNVAKELGEAAVADIVTNVQNVGDAVSGGVEAVSTFFGGLFG